MSDAPLPPPPGAYTEFTRRFPELADAWDRTRQAGESGPLDDRTQRLVKFALAAGTMRPSAVHSATRKARAVGVTQAELEQVIRLAAGLLGFPAAVALMQWADDESRPDTRGERAGDTGG